MAKQTNNMALDALVEQIDQGIETAEDTMEFVSPLSEQDYGSQKQRCVLVVLNSLRFAIPLDGVAEVGTLPLITPLPHIPIWIQGVVSLRGEVVSVVDLGLYLEWSKKRAAGQKFVVIQYGGMKVGLRVDGITGTTNLDLSVDIQTQMVVSGLTYPLGCNVDEYQYCFVDVKRLLQEEKMVEC